MYSTNITRKVRGSWRLWRPRGRTDMDFQPLGTTLLSPGQKRQGTGSRVDFWESPCCHWNCSPPKQATCREEARAPAERRSNHTYSDFAGLVQCFNPVLQIFLVIGLKKIPLREGIDDCRSRGEEGRKKSKSEHMQHQDSTKLRCLK